MRCSASKPHLKESLASVSRLPKITHRLWWLLQQKIARGSSISVHHGTEQQAEQSVSQQQPALLSEMNPVAKRAFETKRRNLVSEASDEIRRHHRQSAKHFHGDEAAVRGQGAEAH